MRALQGLALLLLFQTVGEALAHLLSLPFPGPVVGLVLLLGALRWRRLHEPVAAAAGVLLSHLSLLFVPIGVGVVAHLDLVMHHGWQLGLAIVISTWVGLAVTGAVLQRLLRSGGGDV